MNRQQHIPRQAGVGLVEVMVATLIGAILIIGVIQIFTASRQTFRMQDAMAVAQETGTFALDFVARDALRAGYPGGTTTALAFDWANSQNDVVNASGTNDTFAVIYDSAVSDGRVCTGDVVSGRISNRYYVNETNQLVCEGFVDAGGGAFMSSGSPAEVLVDNVESFQVMYGVDLEHDWDPVKVASPDAINCPDGLSQPTAYINAAAMDEAIDRGASPAGCRQVMDQRQVVRTVRIGLLVRTENKVDVTVPAGKTYTVLDQVPIADPADGLMRRLFAKTIVLRNVEEVLE